MERDRTYVLLYSADYGGAGYAVGFATAGDVAGPYTKHPEPLLASIGAAGYVAPGGRTWSRPRGQDHIVFHSWYAGTTYWAMNVLPVTWEDAPHTEEASDVRPVVEGFEEEAPDG